MYKKNIFFSFTFLTLQKNMYIKIHWLLLYEVVFVLQPACSFVMTFFIVALLLVVFPRSTLARKKTCQFFLFYICLKWSAYAWQRKLVCH